MTAHAFHFDPNRCTGCAACAIACELENAGTPSGGEPLAWRRIHVFNAGHHPALPSWALSLACHHCAAPACEAACPARAIARDAGTGAVLIDAALCIGCRYCTWACPFDAPRFDPARGTVGKCTFCVPRLREGRAPACVVACPTDALALVPRPGAPAPAINAGLPATALAPALVVAPLRGGPPCIETAPELPGPAAEGVPGAEPAERRITLRAEWPLLVLSATVGVLAAVVLARLLGAPALDPARGLSALPFAFAALGGAALLLSLAHLGRPLRAWRAVRNWRSSWLSREVLLVPAFVAAATPWLASANTSASRAGVPVAGLLVGALGLAAAHAVDAVYSVLVPVTGRAAPGRPLLVGPVLAGSAWLAGLLAGLLPLALAAAAWKLAYGLTRLRPACRGRAARVALALRLLVLLPLPLVLIAVAGARWAVAAALLGLAGEWLERALYYAALEPSSPRAELAVAHARALAGQPR